MAYEGGWQTEAVARLGIRLPIVGAPMGGGPSTPALVAAVSEAGGLGSLAGGYLAPDRLRADIAAVRALTAQPFAVNLFAPTPVEPAGEAIEAAQRALELYRQELGLSPRPAAAAGPWAEDFEAQLAVVVEERVPVTSFTFGLLPEAAVAALHDAGSLLVGTATTVDEARAAVASGADLVCAQGSEAGAHRGTFLGPAEQALVGTLALVPQVCDAVDVPVLAAGGIMDGRGVAAALGLGAGAAVLGTAFLRCPESGTSAPYRRALAAAIETSTAVTTAITGRMARGIENRLMRDLRHLDVPPYPVMNTLTSELRRRAAERDEPDLMSLWCGQGIRLATELPAGELVRRLADDAAATIARLAKVAGR
ncbi:MAG: nitronate monooxygenase [Actinomycetota bacterium]|jgi:nitronate monooxygenase|nr:nitronate monooxygenase [Actinomycetota bacterium]